MKIFLKIFTLCMLGFALTAKAQEQSPEQLVQKITDDHTKSIDDLLKVKEAEIMEV